MRRVAILAILALIFLTVTGITVAQERTSNPPEKGDRKGESVQEDTTKKSSTKTNDQKGPAEKSEATATKKSTRASDKGLAEKSETTAQTRAQNTDSPEAKKRKVAEGKKTAEGKSEDASETEDADKPSDKGRPASADKASGNDNPKGAGSKPTTNAGGRPDSVVGKLASKPAAAEGKTEDAGKTKGKGWAKGKGKAQGRGEAEGGSAEKVTVCHKPPGNPENAHTITVGAPAVQAHLRHGDSEGSCGGQP